MMLSNAWRRLLHFCGTLLPVSASLLWFVPTVHPWKSTDGTKILYCRSKKQILMWINPILLNHQLNFSPQILCIVDKYLTSQTHHVSLCSLDSSYLRDIIYSVKHGLHVCSLPQPAGHQPPQPGQSFNERRILNFFTRTFPPLPRSSPPRPSAGRSAGNISQADCEFSNFTLHLAPTLYLMNIDLQWVTWEGRCCSKTCD